MRRSVGERAVKPATVIEGLQVVEDRGGSNAASREELAVSEEVGLDGSEGAFGKSVVVAIALGAHALEETGALEQIACEGG